MITHEKYWDTTGYQDFPDPFFSALSEMGCHDEEILHQFRSFCLVWREVMVAHNLCRSYPEHILNTIICIYIFNYIYTLKARCCCLLHPMYRSHTHHSSLDCAGQCCKKHPLIGLMGFQPPTQQVGYNPIWWVVSVEIQPCMQPRPSGTLNMEALSHSNN